MLSDEKLKNMRKGCIKYNAWPAESILQLLDEIERLKAENEKLKAIDRLSERYDAMSDDEHIEHFLGRDELIKQLKNENEALRKAGDEMAEAANLALLKGEGANSLFDSLNKWREVTKENGSE